MFICKECKTEYETKPQYCDCGNDSFEETTSNSTEETSNIVTPKIEQPSKEQPESESKAMGFFILCIILSALIWFFWGNNQKPTSQTISPKKQETTNNKNIPSSVDSFWDNSKPQQTSKQNGNNTLIFPSLKELKNNTPSTKEPNKIAENNSTIKKKPDVIKTANIQQKNQKISHTKIKKPEQQKTNISKGTKTQKKIASQTTPQKAKRTTNLNNHELNTYKNELRQVLFSHLAVTNIHGSGECQVEFSVSPGGKLLNRKFSKLSDNQSLNDAVYNMLMSVPQFDPPPSSYNGAKIRLNFSFNNGYYEISY